MNAPLHFAQLRHPPPPPAPPTTLTTPTPKDYVNQQKCKVFSRQWVTMPNSSGDSLGHLGQTIGVRGGGEGSQEFHFTSAPSHFLPNRNLSKVLATPPRRGEMTSRHLQHSLQDSTHTESPPARFCNIWRHPAHICQSNIGIFAPPNK